MQPNAVVLMGQPTPTERIVSKTVLPGPHSDTTSGPNPSGVVAPRSMATRAIDCG